MRTVNFRLSASTRSALRGHGYDVTLREPDQDSPTSYVLTLSREGHEISIIYEYALGGDGSRGTITIDVHIQVSPCTPATSSGEIYRTVPSLLQWSDSRPWQGTLSSKQMVTVTAGGERTFVLWLGLDFVWASHYSLRVEYEENPDDVDLTAISSDNI